MKPRLKVVDRGYAAFIKRGKELAREPHTKVGVLGKTDRRSDQATKRQQSSKSVAQAIRNFAAVDHIGNVELAVILHYGDSRNHIPGRPFLSLALSIHADEWEKIMRRIAARHMEGKLDLEKGLALLGEKAAAQVRATITKLGVPPPNAQSTIDRKGSSRPLVDSGRLVQSISHEEVTPNG